MTERASEVKISDVSVNNTDELVPERKYYWVAVNGSSATACLSTPLSTPKVTPTPKSLIGFPTAQEAGEAERFLLNAPIRNIPAQLREWQKRDDMKIVVPATPEPPSPFTMWHLTNK